MERTAWFKRKFASITDNGILPGIIERLSGTPVRIETKIRALEEAEMELKTEGKWSIKEEIGHLMDLEPLWYGRVEDLIGGVEVLREADLQNTRTHQANHNQKSIQELTESFAQHRQRLVRIVREAGHHHPDNTALHPRLRTPMRVVDLAYFVAEHDDHHLARIQELMNV